MAAPKDAPGLERELAQFARLRGAEGWPAAVQALATESNGWDAERRRKLLIAMAEIYQKDFPKKGADTELQRKQLARQFGKLIAQTGDDCKPGTTRLLISLARVAGDHEEALRLGRELGARHMAQAGHAAQTIGTALFNLKRFDEARETLTAIPVAQRSDSVNALLEKMSAADSMTAARESLLAAFAMADAGQGQAAQERIGDTLKSVHPGLKAGMPLTAAALTGTPVLPGAEETPADALVPVFCSGFRWSGASAIYDLLAQQSSVAMFPRRPRFMQDSRSAFEGLQAAFEGTGDTPLAAARAFFAEHVAGIALSGASKKAVLELQTNSILRQLPPDADLSLFDQRLAAFICAYLAAVGSADFPRDAFAAFLRALSALCDPGKRPFVLFDSVIRAAQAAMLRFVPGARMVAVIRDPRDMYVTHVERGNWSKGVKRYIDELKDLFAGYEDAMRDPQIAAACRSVYFSQFIQESQARDATLRWLGIDPALPPDGEVRFVPEQSATNIGVYRGFADQDAIRALEKAFPNYCRGATDSRWAVKVLTFSPMATKRQQMDQMGVAGKPGEPGWARRRQITSNILADGAYDFFGLQHCYWAPGAKHDAVGFFREALAARGLRYDVINRTGDGGNEAGDSTPLYYRRDRWDVDGDEQGHVMFQAAVPPATEPGGGGLLFVHGLFHEKNIDGTPSGRRLYVYNVRLRNQHTDVVDAYRARCFLEIAQHMAARKHPDVPVILLGDTNTKVTDSLADRVLRGLSIELDGRAQQPAIALGDALLALHPEMHGTVRTQHDFRHPGRLKGSDRNSRILFSQGLETQMSEIMTVNEAGMFPSYHYPMRAEFRFA